MNFLSRLRHRLGHRLLGFRQHRGFADGEWITHRGWRYGPVQVVDQNFALCAVAVRLGWNGGIVVWPMDADSRAVQPPLKPEPRS